MANTMNDLYLKYVNRVGKTLETDRYFQYLFEMVRAGTNTVTQKNQILHKVVDERWLGTIEESLDSLFKIVDKPRRFIKTSEEIVPVALARKITADSVRHLSQNTQYIASTENGDIQPTKVLNVTTEETYDLYENRFIYHLIQRLVTFIDKRTDVIFWSTGDEKSNTLVYESNVDDAYEQINYKIEMSIKNRQSFAENDSDNMQVFMRIDRVRRMVSALRNSSFCSIMQGCARVRSPIQRTNLLMKDPDYRNCYKLWQFLESYDEVGYSIESIDSTIEFDEEYLFQLYSNLITNYTVFKSLLEDERNLNEVLNTKRKVTKPKFVKKIQEEFVEDRNIEEVEIRRVFVEEVTQAQLDAEAKLAEEIEKRVQLEKDLEDADEQIEAMTTQTMQLMQMNADAEQRADEEMELREQAEQQLQEANTLVTEAETQITELKKSVSTAVEAKEKAELLSNTALQEKETAILEKQSAIERAEQAEALRIAADAKRDAAEKAQVEAEETMKRAIADAKIKIATVIEETKKQIDSTESESRRKVAEVAQEAQIQIAKAMSEKNQAVTDAENERMIRAAAEENTRKAEKQLNQSEQLKRLAIDAKVEADRDRDAARTAMLKAEEIAKNENEKRLEADENARKARLKAEKAIETANIALDAKKKAEEAKSASSRARKEAETALEIEKNSHEATEKKLQEALKQLEALKREKADMEKQRDEAVSKFENSRLSKYIYRRINGITNDNQEQK